MGGNMKEFNTLKEIKIERENQRSNKTIYSLLGVLIGELDRMPTRNEPSKDDIYKQIVKLHNNAKEMSKYKKESMDELEYLNDFIKAQLTRDQLESIIKNIKDNKCDGKSNIGVIMKELNTLFKGQFDGKMANEIIKNL